MKAGKSVQQGEGTAALQTGKVNRWKSPQERKLRPLLYVLFYKTIYIE